MNSMLVNARREFVPTVVKERENKSNTGILVIWRIKRRQANFGEGCCLGPWIVEALSVRGWIRVWGRVVVRYVRVIVELPICRVDIGPVIHVWVTTSLGSRL